MQYRRYSRTLLLIFAWGWLVANWGLAFDISFIRRAPVGQVLVARAADGGGTNTVSPTVAPQNTASQMFTFTYTADATKDSGGMTITVPSDWSAPQGTGGTAGYTTVSSQGLAATVINSLDATTGWSWTPHMTLSADTSDKKENKASLLNTISAQAGPNENWYFNYGIATTWGTAANGANGQRVGMWLKSSVNTASGNLHWLDDDTANLASPLDTLAIAALTANTWQYTSVTLGAARTSQLSYGFRYTTDLGAATVRADSMSVLFDAADVTTNWLGDTSITAGASGTTRPEGTNAIKCTYADAAGIGASGECYRTSTALTVVPSNQVTYWVSSSVALAAGDFAWVDDDSANLASVVDTVSLPAISANTWTYVTATATNINTISVRSYGLRQVVDKGALIIAIDAIGTHINAAEATTGWSVPTPMTLATNSVVKEGSASLKNTIIASSTAGDKWYQTLGAAQDWSGYTKVGFWVSSSVATNAGDLQFEYDDATDLSSPLSTLNIGTLSANTWSYQKLTFTTTRNSVSSYGIKYTTDIGAAVVSLDYVLAGPGVPTFSGTGPWDINVPFFELSVGQTVTVTYGSGGGSSGVTTPNTVNTDTFTTKDRDASDGTLTTIASSPTVLLNAQPAVGTVGDSPDPVTVGSDVTFNSGTWTDGNGSETVKLFVCKTNALSSPATGGCSGGAWFTGSSYTATNPQTGAYTSQSGDVATSPNNYYVFICDVKAVANSCSTSGSGTFTVQAAPSMTFTVTTNDFPNVTPGTPVYATSTLSVNTSNGTGWNVTLYGNDRVTGDSVMDLNSDAAVNIPDQAEWVPGAVTTTAGNAVVRASLDSSGRVLAFRVMSASGTVAFRAGTWWGTTDADGTAEWAGIPSTTAVNKKVGNTSVSSGGSAALNTVQYYLDVPNTQKTGAYSGGLTFTATTN